MVADLLNGLIVGNNFLPVLLGHDVVDEVDYRREQVALKLL